MNLQNTQQKNSHPASTLVARLRWYKKHTETLVGEEFLIRMSISELHALFNVFMSNMDYHCWHVKTRQARVLNKIAKHKLSLDKFEYFVEQIVLADVAANDAVMV